MNKYWNSFFEYIQKNYESFLILILKIIVIIILIQLAQYLIRKATDKIFKSKFIERDSQERIGYLKTLLPIVLTGERYILYFIGLLLILKTIGIDTSALLGSAGIIGLAFSFGAKDVVQDFISGFFLIFDGLIKVGDVITVGDITGEVEKIDLRNIMLREFPGRLWAIPNGEIRSFGNFNRDWVRAVVEVGISYDEDIEKGMNALKDIAETWTNNNSDIVLEEPQVQGVNTLGESSVVIRIVIKLKPLKHWGAERDLKKMIKEKFSEESIEIPYSRRVVYNKTLL